MAEHHDELFKDFEKYKKSDSKEHTKPDEHELNISIRVNKLMVERAAYWIAILALIIALVYNPLVSLAKCSCETTVESGSTVKAGGATITDIQETGGAAQSAGDTSGGEEQQEASETPNPASSLSGKVTSVISSISVERDDSDVPTKLLEVKFSVKNEADDFRPKIMVYAYADDNDDDIKSILRAEATFPTLMAGASKDYTITKFKSKYLSADASKDQVVYVQIYNADNNKLIKEISKAID